MQCRQQPLREDGDPHHREYAAIEQRRNVEMAGRAPRRLQGDEGDLDEADDGCRPSGDADETALEDRLAAHRRT